MILGKDVSVIIVSLQTIITGVTKVLVIILVRLVINIRWPVCTCCRSIVNIGRLKPITTTVVWGGTITDSNIIMEVLLRTIIVRSNHIV